MRRPPQPRSAAVDFPRDAFLPESSRRGCSALPRKQGHKLCTDRYYNLNCYSPRFDIPDFGVAVKFKSVAVTSSPDTLALVIGRLPLNAFLSANISPAILQTEIEGIHGVTTIARSSGTRIQRAQFCIDSCPAFSIAERMKS